MVDDGLVALSTGAAPRRLEDSESMSETTSSRPYWASRWENRFDAALASVLRRRGWEPRIEPYTGYGLAATDPGDAGDRGDGWVRVLGRVVLAPRRAGAARPGSPGDPTALPESSAPTPRRFGRPRAEGPEPLRAVRGWRSFLTAQLPGAHVIVTVDGHEHRTVADRGGYVDVVVSAGFGEGWHEVSVRPAEDGPTVSAPVRVVGRQVRTGLVSDVDDTVMVTSLPRPLTAIWNLLVLHEDARRPVRGMADLYAEIDSLEDQLPVVYLSTNTWNGAAALRRFFAFHGLPAGPMLLTDWGPTNTGWFRSGREHKFHSLERLARELPHVRWILVGDDGQHDPLVYNRFAQMYPDHVRAIAIRQLSPGEQVLAHGAPTPTVQARAGMSAGAGPAIPVVSAPDGARLRRSLRAAGVLPGGPATMDA